MTPIPPTPMQMDVLRVLTRWIDGKGVAPSLSDIGAELNLRSKSSVHRLLDGLEERGWIARQRGRMRAIIILHRPPELADTSPTAAWRPIGEAQPGVDLILGNAAGVYADTPIPTRHTWARGFIHEDGTAWGGGGYRLTPTHFFVVPDVPAEGLPMTPLGGAATGK